MDAARSRWTIGASHGTKVSGSNQIWFAVLGPDTPAKGEMKEAGQYYQNQVAKTAATLLGVTCMKMKKNRRGHNACASRQMRRLIFSFGRGDDGVRRTREYVTATYKPYHALVRTRRRCETTATGRSV